MPWACLESLIEPFYPKAGNGRRPYPLSVMFRIHCMQQWYNLSDPAMEDALYDYYFNDMASMCFVSLLDYR